MLRKLFSIALVLAFTCLQVGAGPVHVRGYYRKDGTYVRPHTRSLPSSHGSSSAPVFTPPPEEPRSDYRTSARTTPRSTGRQAYTASLNNVLQLDDSSRSPAEDHASRTSVEPATKPIPNPEHHFPFRYWKDSTGQFTVYARLRSVASSHVKLMREDESLIDVLIDRLSAEDQQYIKDILR